MLHQRSESAKRRNTTEKAKTPFGFSPSAMGDTVPAWKPSSPCFWSKDVTLVTQELWEGLWEPPGSWAPPAISLASVCIYIYIYLSLSISLSHAALGIEEEQTAKQEVRMGAPVCREQGHPKAHSHTALASTSGFFLAYILQQYRNSLQYPEPWRSSSSGSGAEPSCPVPAPGPGVLVSCLAWAGRAGDSDLTATAAPLQHCKPTESFLQLSPFLHPQQAGPGSQPSSGTCCPGSGRCHHAR